MMTKDLIRLGALTELARREFFYYCKLKAPDFYKESRSYLVELCGTMQEFVESDYDVLIVNAPPRHGKSRTAGLLVEWLLGKRPESKIMTGSYNETLSTTFSKTVRDDIMEIKADVSRPVFSDVFPGVTIKKGDAAMNLWSLQGGHNNYLATSPTGTATGFGADLILIDDLIKNELEANNESIKEKHYKWFTDTILSRLEEGGKIIVIMTRWASDDLSGRIFEEFPEQGYKVKSLIFKACQEDGTMLCDEVLSYGSYQKKRRSMSPEIVEANYQQVPIDLKGGLYQNIKTYSGELPTFKQIKSYTDTADTGADFLCSFVYGQTFDDEAYILDAMYTKAPMEETEPATAELFVRNKVNLARIESNNGGRGFARNVQREMERLGSNLTVVKWFHQSNNKQARIYSQSAWIQEHVYFPEGWHNRWPDLYQALTRYQKEGKNAHDDAPDALTGVAEDCQKGGGMSVFK